MSFFLKGRTSHFLELDNIFCDIYYILIYIAALVLTKQIFEGHCLQSFVPVVSICTKSTCYSVENFIQIYLHCPHCTNVGGLRTDNELFSRGGHHNMPIES